MSYLFATSAVILRAEESIMYYFISILTGLLIASTIAMNGELTTNYGLYSASVFIHLSGLFLISVMLIAKKLNPFIRNKANLSLYLGGVVGVLTVLFTNLSFGKISVSAILALNLLGQCIASLIIDQFGLFDMPKHPFRLSKLFGIAFVLAGIVFMILPLGSSAILAVFLSFLTGFTIVLSRTINAGLAQKIGVFQSTFFNYLTGLLVSTVLMFIIGRNEPLFTGLIIKTDIWIYLGGLVGVIVITLLNYAVSKITSLYMTLLIFIGQVFSGVAIDYFLSSTFSMKNLFGGMMVLLGLTINVLIDKKRAKTKVLDALN